MILNLTQHAATPEQVAAGVVEPKDKATVQRILDFQVKPTGEDIIERAEELAKIARAHFGPQKLNEDWRSAMIGGAPFLMGPLEIALRAQQIHPEFAFSVRESREERQADGSVKKVAVFRHVGFVLGATTEMESI